MFTKLLNRNRVREVPACVAKRTSLSYGTRYRPVGRYGNYSGPFDMNPPVDGFLYTGTNRADFFRYMRDHIPIISAGIWTWVHLCSTSQFFDLRGTERNIRRADKIIRRLERRIYPRLDGDTHGLRRLTESFFVELFTLGRFAARVHFLEDGSGIRNLEMLDPYRIKWKRNNEGILHPFYELENGEIESIDPRAFFYRSLVADLGNPGGIEPLACIPFVVEIEQRMLEDMARSSHNAGTPRLQIRISPPAPNHGEDPDSYANRINSYFERTVNQFDDLGPDDNVFTWSDVEINMIGGSTEKESGWKINREQVLEDVITGLKLFPWALGRSHGTTKNWVFAQYNLLMQIVDSIQTFGKDLAEWLMRFELRLKGNNASATWLFEPNQDPFIVERNKAKLLNFERVDQMVEKGYISLDQGARELGYKYAYKSRYSEEQDKQDEAKE